MDDGTPHYHDNEELIWDTQNTTWVECHSCGWGAEVTGLTPLEEVFAPVLDPSIEDLPDEEDIDAEISSNTERDSSANVPS